MIIYYYNSTGTAPVVSWSSILLLPLLKQGGYVFRSVCLSVCYVTQKVMNGFWRGGWASSKDQMIRF